jgi:hypothetical protein
MVALNFHCVVDGHRLTVEMSRSRLLSVDYCCGRTERVDKRIFVDVSGKEIHAHHGGVKWIAGMDYGNVKFTVGY